MPTKRKVKTHKNLLTIREKDGLRGEVPSLLSRRRDRPYDAYLETLNPRGNDDVQQALAITQDVRFQAFLDRVNNPRFIRVSLTTVAKTCGISLMEFQDWWRKACNQRALAEAQLAGPSIVGDMVVDSRSYMDICDRCDGLGTVTAPEGLEPAPPGYRLIKQGAYDREAIYIRTCTRCSGEGKIRRAGDTHARDVILEMSGLKDSSKGASVVLNFGGASHSSAVSFLDEAMSIDKKSKSTRIIDAEDLE